MLFVVVGSLTLDGSIPCFGTAGVEWGRDVNERLGGSIHAAYEASIPSASLRITAALNESDL